MSSTNFLNSKQRRIFQSEKGAFFVKTAAGKKSYGPKAAFRKPGADGSVRKLTKSNANVPRKIAPAARKVRKNAGVARGARFGSAQAQRMMARLMNKTYKPPKAKAGARPAVARKPRSVKFGSAQAQKMMTRLMNKTYKAPKAKAGARPGRSPKVKAMIATPGGTVYRNAAHMRRRKAASLKKRQLNANPFAALMNMRVAGARQ